MIRVRCSHLIRILSALAILSGCACAEPIEAILSRMDHSAKDFRSVSAKMKRVHYTAVLNDSSETSGTLRSERVKGETIAVFEFDKPDSKTIFFKGKTVQIYYPNANTEEIYDLSKYTSGIDKFLLLGLGGTSGADLRKSYDIKLSGTETIASTVATRLELTPKSDEVRKLATRIDLWIPEGQSNPIQEKITEPSKDYELAVFSDVKLNPSFPDAAFELKLPANVKKVYPQR